MAAGSGAHFPAAVRTLESHRPLSLAPRSARRSSHSAAASLAHTIGNRAFRQVIARDPPKTLPPNRQLGPGTPDPNAPQMPAGAEWVELSKVEYTQPGISFSTKNRNTGEDRSVGRMAAQMKRSGWDMTQPADMVRMDDGRLVSLDHRRLWAADRAGITHVSARVHKESDRLDASTAGRFEIDKKQIPRGQNPRTGQPWKAGDEPATWGDAVRFRSAVQGFGKAGRQGNQGIEPGSLANGGGTRDPHFPAAGSKDKPMRMQPGPLETGIDPTAGGSVIKSGGRRQNVPSGKIVQGTIDSESSHPPGGGGGGMGEPSVVTDVPGTVTGTGRTGAGTRRTVGGRGQGDVQELEEGGGGDWTAEEMEAITGPTSSGPGLLMMLGQWMMSGWYARQQAELDELQTKQITQQIADRVKALDYLTMAYQLRGDIAYVQVVVTTTHTSANQYAPDMTVRDLKSVTVSDWFRQGSERVSGVLDSDAGITKYEDTNSYALPLHPAVISIAASQLTSQMGAANTAQRAKLGHCLHLLKQKGPNVVSFNFLGSECLGVFPGGSGPPK